MNSKLFYLSMILISSFGYLSSVLISRFQIHFNGFPFFRVHINFLDLTDNQIKEEKTRLLGAKLGYYSEDVERFLGTIERGFGEATKRIIKSIQQNSDVFELTEKDILYIKYFSHYMLIRSNYFLSIVREGRIFAKIFNGFYTPIILFVLQRILRGHLSTSVMSIY